jgi:MscS family membrane protein
MIDQLTLLLKNITGDNQLLFRALLGALAGLAVISGGKLFKWFLGTVGKRLIAKTETDLDDIILDIINSRVIALSSVIGIYVGMKQLRLGLAQHHDIVFELLAYADTALYLVSVLIVASVFTRIVRTVTVHTMRKIAERNKNDDFNQTLAPLVNRVITFTIVAFTILIVMEHFGQNVASLLTILGAGSLALGLAAQDTISNMISGFIIMIDRPFRVGDRVKIPSGEVGDVFEIGLRSTKILDFDNNVLIAPNNELIKTKIINYGYPDSVIRVAVEVGVAYGSDIDQVKNILLNAAHAQPDVLKEPAPEAFLMKFGDSALHFTLFCRVPDVKLQFLTGEKIRVRIYKELIKAGIEIPYPQQVVHNKYDDAAPLHSTPKRKKIQR